MIRSDFQLEPAVTKEQLAVQGGAGASTIAPIVFADENCPVIQADMICLGTSPLGMVRVAYFSTAESV